MLKFSKFFSAVVFSFFLLSQTILAATYGTGNYGRGLYSAGGDSTAPVVNITQPSSGATVTGNATISANATDDVGVAGVQFVLDGSTNIGAVDTQAPYSVVWNSALVSNGTHTLTAVATDAASNSTASAGIVVTVDNAAPVRTGGSPSGTLAFNTTSTNLTLTTNEVALCRYSTTSGTAFDQMTNTFSSTSNTSHSTTISGLSNGSSYNYYVRCADGQNIANTSDLQISFSVAADNSAPTVSVTAPSSGSTVSGSSVSLTATASDNVAVIGVQFKIDGTNIGSEITSSPYAFFWDSITYSNGSHTVTAIARDGSGNSTTSGSVTVTVDNAAPTRSGGAPTGSLAAGTTSTTISLTTNEAAICKYSTNASHSYASMPNTFSNTNSTSHSSVVSGLSNGSSYNYYVKCRDAQNNANQDNLTISFNISTPLNTSPTANAGSDQSITLPTNSVTLSGSGTDSDGNIASYAWTQISGPTTATIASPNTQSTSVSALTTAGTYIFQLTVIDNNGAIGTDTISIVVSAAPNAGFPVVALTAPSNNVTVSGSITVSATATDNISVSGVQFKLDGSNLGSEVTTSPYSISWNTTSASEGAHVLTAVARDGSGNSTTSASRTVTVDNTPPTRTNASPAGTLAANTSSTTLSITTPGDNGVCKYSTTPGTSYGAMTAFSTTNTQTHTTTVSGLSNGTTYTYYVKCSDAFGNSNTDDSSITFTINTPSNSIPVASAGGDESIILPTTTATLSGSGTDADGAIALYTWTQIAGPTAIIASPNSQSTSVSGLTTAGTYTFRLTVTDSIGATDTDDANVIVNSATSGSGSSGGGRRGGGGGGSPAKDYTGCTTNTGFSPVTGNSCIGYTGTASVIPGCTGYNAFSPITGQACPAGLTPTPIQPSSSTVIVTTSILNVRSQPNTTAPVVSKLSRGNTVTSVESLGVWTKIRLASGTEGFVSSMYVASVGTSSAPSSNTVRVANVRTSVLVKDVPGGNSIGSIPVGTTGTVIDRIPSAGGLSWVKVQFPTVTGYVSSMYLQPVVSNIVSSAPAVYPSTPFVPTTQTSGDTVRVINVRTSVVAKNIIGGISVGSIPVGTVGTVLERAPSDGVLSWVKVQFPQATGWVSSYFLSQ